MFISEFLTFVAGVTAGPMWLVVVVALGLTVAISALTRIALKSVFGHAPQGMGKHEAPALMLIPEIILAVMILWFGIAPRCLSCTVWRPRPASCSSRAPRNFTRRRCTALCSVPRPLRARWSNE